MNHTGLNFYRQFFFVLIVVLGAAYLFLLFVFSQKVFSGFAMQFIFLFDVLLIHPGNIFNLILRRDFIIPVISGFVWLYLLWLFVRALRVTLIQIRRTRRFASCLKITSITSDYTIIKSASPEVFVLGFFRPRVFISTKLLRLCNPDEIASILLHERSHLRNFDPLKNVVVDFISGFLPDFAGKTYLFGQYRTLVEISCDTYSQYYHPHPTSLVSALLKIGEANLPALEYGSRFSSQSERIKVLVGAARQPLLSLAVANLSMITFFVISASFLIHTDLFYQCSHVARCFFDLFARDHVILRSVSATHQCNLN